MEEIIPPIMEKAMIKLLSHFRPGLFARTPNTTAITRPVNITAACTVSPNIDCGYHDFYFRI